ncbi:MAG: PspC domain-containing protein [Bacteroidia bacterium]
MKKTINISLGGIVFHIEEDAHQKLSAYLDAISDSMQGSEGKNEIMADIEARIAELLQPKVNDFKQVITIAEIEEIISTMGSPEEFATGNAETKKEEPLNTGEKGRYQYGQRRIFRDPDDKVLGGVCSGLAYHFGIDPIWLRLGFGLSIFLGGFGFLLYILLLIIIPKARTAAEKLEMRGEPVDVNNIRKIIEEDMQDFKRRARNFGDDMKNWRRRSRGQQFERNVGDFFASFGHGLGSLIGAVVKGILLFIGFILVIVFASLLVALVLSLWTGMNIVHIEAHDGHMINYSAQSFFNMLDINGWERNMLLTGVFLFIGIPLLGLIVRFVRAMIGRKRPFQWFTVTASILWTAAWIFMIIGIASVSKHFSVTDHESDEAMFTLPRSANTMYLKMAERIGDEDVSVRIDSLNFYMSDDDIFRGSPSLCIAASPDTNFYLMMKRSGRGANMDEAKESANSIAYSFAAHDSVLELSPYYQIVEGKPWRRQKLEGLLEIPLGKAVVFPEGIDHIICATVHHKHRHLGGHKWIMTKNGLESAEATF